MSELIDEVVNKIGVPKKEIVFFLDNARIHLSYYIRNYLMSLGIKFYFNAAYSPALNPVELVFGFVKFEIRKSNAVTK